MLAATTAAVATGVATVVAGRGGRGGVVLEPGGRAPDFELSGSDGRVYRLTEMIRAGQIVVIAWFPKAFTPGCTAECESLGASSHEMRQIGVRLFGASVDTPAANARFAQSLGIDYPILSDPGGTVARAYGVLGASGFASRWTFYIGRDGRILDIDRRVKASLHGRDIVTKLRALGS